MSVDLSRVATLTTELMDRLDREYGDQDVQVGAVALVVEIDSGPDGDDPGWTYVTYRCSDPRHWIQAGLFEAARRGVLES